MISFLNIDFYAFGCTSLWHGRSFFSCMGVRTLSCVRWNLVPWPGIKPRALGLGAQRLSHYTTREVPQWYNFYTCSHLQMEKPKFRKANNASRNGLAWEGLSWEQSFARAWGLTEPAPGALSFEFDAWCSWIMWQKLSPTSILCPLGSLYSGNSIDSLKSGVEELAQAFLSP